MSKLQKAGLNVNLITDASVYAIMSRVDKVVISTHAIMANGGLIANSGAYMIALAAKVSFYPDIMGDLSSFFFFEFIHYCSRPNLLTHLF